MIVVIFFFFFQAEDGIRDKLVTGVQTCALPISFEKSPASRQSNSVSAASMPDLIARWMPLRRAPFRNPPRSEERRVGEEGRSRWAPDHLKKKKKKKVKY